MVAQFYFIRNIGVRTTLKNRNSLRFFRVSIVRFDMCTRQITGCLDLPLTGPYVPYLTLFEGVSRYYIALFMLVAVGVGG